VASFYTDHDVALQVALLLRQIGHTAITARDLGLERAGDDEHLLTAAQRGWILVTHNRQHFLLLHDAWRRWLRVFGVSTVHAGILIPPHGFPSQTVQLLHDFLTSGLPLSNELYVWRSSSGWTHRL
jgi:predicted nuclease of predicted toxin-antitoxin system